MLARRERAFVPLSQPHGRLLSVFFLWALWALIRWPTRRRTTGTARLRLSSASLIPMNSLRRTRGSVPMHLCSRNHLSYPKAGQHHRGRSRSLVVQPSGTFLSTLLCWHCPLHSSFLLSSSSCTMASAQVLIHKRPRDSTKLHIG